MLVLWVGANLRAQDQEAHKILAGSVALLQSASMEYEGEIVTIAQNGRERRKTWRSYRAGDGAAASRLIRFLSPPEVRGVGFLQRGEAGRPPNQWIYLPSMRRERRIAPQDRASSFAGTDFSFEDLEEIDPARYDAFLEPERTLDGHACHVIRIEPRERSAYDRKLVMIRKDTREVLAIEAFRPGHAAPAKRLLLSDYREIQAHRVAMTIEISDLVKGSRTVVHLTAVALDRPQPPDRFTLQNLTREGVD